MATAQQLAALAAVTCDVAFDDATRQLYATDASIYQVEPMAVAFPRDTKQARSVIKAAVQAGISIIPRGAGTGLAGGALGEGLVVDLARHNKTISDLDLEKGTVRVGAGVVLDQLNAFLRPHGYGFGPDVASSSRATLGGMIANDSSGAHALVHGTTAGHVAGLELVLSGGQLARIYPDRDSMPRQREMLEDMISLNGLMISERFPADWPKRWPGYGLSHCLKEPGNLINLICGSEGTLAAIVSAELKIVRLPKEKGLALICFQSLTEAMHGTVELLRLRPAAIEHLDRVLLDQTRGQASYQAARDLLELDATPCESILVVEFFEDVADRLAAVERMPLGCRKIMVREPFQADLVWALRKAGLSLLTGCKGDAKPVTGIEDTAVRPEKLPDYVRALGGLLQRHGLTASFYGHAACGLLHVRPVLDLHSRADAKKFRLLANDVAALVREFGGSLAAEHGVGIARTEFLPKQLGEPLMNLMREIKDSFDPHHLFNPGKIVPDGRYEFDSDLRIHAGRELALPFEPVLAYRRRDESFVRHLEQCNGCGACLKDTPTMCPTFAATGDEMMSTRGRANTIRAVLELRGAGQGDPIASPALDDALGNCLSCKACLRECPSQVNLALLKAELLHARIQRHGLSAKARLLGSVDRLGRIGCMVPWLANLLLDSRLARFGTSRFLGITSRRELPHYAKQRFDRWFGGHPASPNAFRGRVMLWDDTFVRYHEPRIGIAAVRVLEAAGYEVELAKGRDCCGRPAFSQGNFDEVTRLGNHNLELLQRIATQTPILFLEPSCHSMFIEDYQELRLPDADAVAKRCFLFQDFLSELLSREPAALKFNEEPANVIIHLHCHSKALANAAVRSPAHYMPERKVTVLDAGCCGMAGAFGMSESKYDLSVKVARPLIRALENQPFGTIFVTSGASCRHQVQHLTPIRSQHIAELLEDALEGAK